jgi:hypothetical protein
MAYSRPPTTVINFLGATTTIHGKDMSSFKDKKLLMVYGNESEDIIYR